MKIEVFGPGCRRCTATAEVIKATLAELEREAEVVKVTDIRELASRGVLSTPDMVKGWLK